MENAPKAHDWVKARAECSIDHVFMLLGEVVTSDVERIKERLHERTTFSVNRPTDTKLVVSRSENELGARFFRGAVMFEKTPAGIEVSRADKDGPKPPSFVARPGLDAVGSCRLEVDGQPLELWQVSRKALEDLFFS